MTLDGLATILETTGLPVTYLAFPPEEAPEMPFIVYQDTGSNNFGADNKVYFSATRVQVDLLTAEKDRTTEQTLEGVFDTNGIFWERTIDFDEDESNYRVTYEIEI